MNTCETNKQCVDKPHVKKNKHGWWECSGPSVVGSNTTILTANGFTKEEAYNRWCKEESKARWGYSVLCSLREEFLR